MGFKSYTEQYMTKEIFVLIIMSTIFFSTLLSSAQMPSRTAPAALNTNADSDKGDDRDPQLTTDGSGTWIAVWESGEPEIGGGIGTDYDILVSGSTDGGETWSAKYKRRC